MSLEPEHHVTCLVQQPRTDPVCYAPTIQMSIQGRSLLSCIPFATPSSFDLFDSHNIEFFARADNTFAVFRRDNPAQLP
ncbi:unnamed protein product [Jaminaea pallidilutea]